MSWLIIARVRVEGPSQIINYGIVEHIGTEVTKTFHRTEIITCTQTEGGGLYWRLEGEMMSEI